jgi:hypothetical protein
MWHVWIHSLSSLSLSPSPFSFYFSLLISIEMFCRFVFCEIKTSENVFLLCFVGRGLDQSLGEREREREREKERKRKRERERQWKELAVLVCGEDGDASAAG